jgi:DNA-directed RNA polymerase specialized sigma24 family protein
MEAISAMSFSCSSLPLNSIVHRAEETYNQAEKERDVFESHRHHIFSVAYYMTGDEREAEIILGQTFIEAFRKHRKPGAQELDEQLMHELAARLSLDPVPAATPDGAALSGRNVRRTDMEEAVWQLPGQERLCFLLRDVENYPPERIALLLALPAPEVRRVLLSARIRLRQILATQVSSNA